MAIKKLVKLSHKDPQVNQVQRNVEDVLSSVNLHLQSGSLLSAITASLDARYSSQTSVSQASGAYMLLSASAQAVTGTVTFNDGLYVTGLPAGDYRTMRIESNAYRQLEIAGINGAQTCGQMDDQTGNGAFWDFCINGYEMYSIGKPYDQSFVLGDNAAGYDIWRYTNQGSSGSFQFATPVPVTASGFYCQNFFQCGGNATFYSPVAMASSLSVSGLFNAGFGGNLVGNFNLTGNLGTLGNQTLAGNSTVSGFLRVTGSATLTGSAMVVGNSVISGNLLVTGSVGIGTSQPSQRLHVANGNLLVTNTDPGSFGVSFALLNNGTNANPLVYMQLSSSARDWRIQNNFQGDLLFWDQLTSSGRLRLQSSTGYVGVNISPNEQLHVNGVVRSTGFRCLNGNAGTSYGNIFNVYWTGTQAQLWIDTTNIGNISTTSDRRLKKNIVTMSGSALATLGQLRPVAFNWMTMGAYVDDGMTHLGFIADEVQQVIPSAVSGQPSGTMPNGSASYQTLVPSEMTPYFVKGIQELSASSNWQSSMYLSQSAQIASLQSASASFAAQAMSQSLQIASLQQASSSFASQIAQLQAQQSASQGQIVSLQVSLAALSGTVAVLQKLVKPI